MGTHPIFESDFDCLTDESEIKMSEVHQSENNNEETLPLSPDCVQKKITSDSERDSDSNHSSSSSSRTESGPLCRICHSNSGINSRDGSSTDTALITPCRCKGTLQLVHRNCLERWVRTADTKSCELCHHKFDMTSRLPPFKKWKRLSMSANERKRILMSITFHVIALACVVWSLYVLIEKTAEELKNHDIKWPFWTKLVVVGVGFTGGLVFMYVQCRVYVDLIKRFKNENKVIYVQSLQMTDNVEQV